MATAKNRKKRRVKRPVASYLAGAKSHAHLIPKLKKFKRRKTLTPAEKRFITRQENKVKNIPDIVPVTRLQAKRLGKRKLLASGVQGIQLRGIDQGQKVTIDKRGNITILSDGRTWIYWGLPKSTVRSRVGMRDAGKRAFNKEYPIDQVADLARKAFKKYDVKQVNLWAHAGIVGGGGFEDIDSFIRWVNEKWQNGRYITVRQYSSGDIYSDPSDPGKWVNGIAILIEDPAYTRARKALAREEVARKRAARKL